ncbi:ComEA family DNA-binding protein [Ramlibacter sp. AN1133]|uniref:ComEA family DNA-binding protein n=1 Tax=Ramlibacter sp. AN1133 TaxID=3133429 RepID=UPI0030BE8402
MLKKILVILAMLYAAVAFAAVDVNKATATELDGIKGIGPVMSKRILEERKKGEFKSWDDLIGRVKGIAPITAAKFSAGGLTVNGTDFKNPAVSKNAPKEDKKEAKADAKADKKDAKADKKEEKAVAKAEKKDDKAAAAKPAASAKK